MFTEEDTSHMPSFAQRLPNSDGIESIVLNPAKILKQLQDLNISKACGPDDFHPKFLKECAEDIYKPLHSLFCKSLQQGELPLDWKKANVSCIYKKGPKCEPGNYRPISLTSVVCKLLERNIKNSVVEHLSSNDLLSDAQYGFREHRSTVLQLLEVLEHWTAAIDENQQVDSIYFDFAKAFDKVPHQRLLTKIKSYGINGRLLSWIESFLSSREQRVVINGCKSEWTNVKSGVPQGSILGPLLFILYINDLPECVSSVCKLFADDTKLYRTIVSTNDSVLLQKDIESMNRWSNEWQLSFNIGKCKVVQYGNVTFDTDYQMMNEDGTLVDLQTAESEKDLGIHFTSSLRFDLHISKVVNKANSITGLIKRNFVYMDNEHFLLLYKSLVRPHLDYGNSIYNPITKKNKRILENVQRRATKLVPGLQNNTYEYRLRALNLPTLEYRRQRGDLIILFKIMHKIDDTDLTKFFVKSTDQHGVRGNSLKLCKPRANKNPRLHSFSHRVINHWNQLPDGIIQAKDVTDFKTKLDRLWMDRRFNLDVIY